MMKSSYLKEDVTILLKDLTGIVEPLDTEERERIIQGGGHYSEMLPKEYRPSNEYMDLYREALNLHGGKVAKTVAILSKKIMENKGKDITLVSLARAGTPIGILIKRYIKRYYNIEASHYSISIIRGKGIDHNAMKYILTNHRAESIQFIDGWIGKGAINKELHKELEQYKGVSKELAVLSDPAYITDLYGTREDFIIPSSCLNATVSGLLSRTIHREELIGKNDFHGAVYYEELQKEDLTYDFIQKIEKLPLDKTYEPESIFIDGEDVNRIKTEYNIKDINLIKPGIGETTRVLLRRLPWKILVYSLNDKENLGHIYRLAREKGVEVMEYPLSSYKACGIIKDVGDI